MASTANYTVGTAWVRIASGRNDGQMVRVEGSGRFYFCLTVGKTTELPTVSPLTGHPVTTSIDLPLVANQHLWASAPSPIQMTVT